jgi:glycosyltransferase involved in cell wall biosynthesis
LGDLRFSTLLCELLNSVRFSIIIPCHNRAPVLGKTIGSLIRQHYPHTAFEIIVADNCSTDDTKRVVNTFQAKSPVEIVYFFESRLGVHYARNAAALKSRGEILYFTDDDMEAEPGVLAAFDLVLQNHPHVGAVTGRVLPKWGAAPPEWILKLCNNGTLSLQQRNEELVISKDDVGVYSCHEAIRKSALLECGGFRPENTGGTWVGDGETGLHHELAARGYFFAFTNQAISYHLIPPERLTQRYYNRRMKNQGFADGFTAFNRGHVRSSQLSQQAKKHLLRSWVERTRAVKAFCRGRVVWRQHQAMAQYWLARREYDLRLLRDENWRLFVGRTNWFDEADDKETLTHSRFGIRCL